ncbi:uncharacterized protein LOC132555264 [Ylistrum balloti]|uniref:uncharacterized protein LOC132555264 n=1 Tax=Ylistrum balloti TaxID=509963 RepID=UPI002905E4B1|nr:uncharacterized protein LOC132555264 [Ylistrum balloti]
MDCEETSDVKDSTLVCVHCQCSISLADGQNKWPVTTCISGLTHISDILHEKVPDCKFTVSDDSFVCKKCFTVLEKIVKKQEVASLMQKESLQAELELKMLMSGVQLEGMDKEELDKVLLDRDTAKSEDDGSRVARVEWFAMMTDRKSQQLVAHCSKNGAKFVEKNQEIFKMFPQFCFSDNGSRTEMDHNYSSKESSGDKDEEKKVNKQEDSVKENTEAVPSSSKSRRRKAIPAKAASPTKTSNEDAEKLKPKPVQVSRKRRRSKVADEDPNFEPTTDSKAQAFESTQCHRGTRSALRVALRTRKGIGPDKDHSYSSFAGYSTPKTDKPKKEKGRKEECKNFVPSHIDVFSLDHPGNKEVADKILTTFQKIDPDKPSPNSPRDSSKPWACLRCTFVTTCRKRALLHFRLVHDLRDLWSRFHICQIMPEKGKEDEELQDQYRLHRPLLCVLCGRDYVNKSAEFHVTKDHPGITSKQIPLIIIKKEAGPKLIILYLYGRPPITYLLDTKGRLHEVKKINTSSLKQKVSFAFQEIKPSVPISIDGEVKEEDEEDLESTSRYKVEVIMYGCSLAEGQPGSLSIFASEDVSKPPEDLSTLRTKLLERVRIGTSLPTKKTKINASNKIEEPRYTCKVCHAASNSRNIQEMHHINHPKQVGKWECTLCGERFTKANLILTHIGIFHDLLAQQALSHMKAIGVETSAKLLYNQEKKEHSDNENEGAISEGAEDCGTENDKSKLEESNGNDEAVCSLPSTEEINVWKKQLENIKHCEVCCKAMNTNAALMKHMRVAHKIRNYRCPVCSMSFISYSYLVYHMEESHQTSTNNSNYLCTSCSRVFTSRNDFVQHCVNHIKENFRCNICNEVLLSADKLSLHMKSHFPKKALLDTPYVCPICNKVIKERKKVEMHLITHCTTMIEAYRCTMCTKTCVTEQGLRTHMEGHKQNKEMVCHICGKVFKRPHRLRDHLRMHENPDPFKCRICHKMVSSEEGMKRHMELVHSTTRKKEVVCHLCGKELASNYSLTMHLKLVHNPNKVKRPLKNRQCQYCNKVYIKPYQLTHHIDVHHAGRNFYPCKYCGETFSSRSLYRRHVDIHPEFKPWRCKFCPEKFVFQKTLIDHITQNHPGQENAKVETRFACNICGNTYGKLWSLRNHLDVEHNDQRELANCEKIKFYCPFCNRGFLYKTGLDIHMAKTHKQEMAVTNSELIAVEAVAHEETVAAVEAATEAAADETCIIEAPATITLEQEEAVQLLSQLQFQVEQNYIIQ